MSSIPMPSNIILRERVGYAYFEWNLRCSVTIIVIKKGITHYLHDF